MSADAADVRLGVVVTADSSYGGAYQYTRTVIQALESSPYTPRYFYFDENWEDSALYGERWERLSVPEQALRYGASKLFERTGVDPAVLGSARKALSPTLLRYDPDLTLYPTPSPMAFEVGFDYLMAIHDLQHRINPQFPEVSAGGEYRHREYLFGRGSEHAAGILADSETGKQDVVRFYDVDESAVHVLPFVPPDYLDDAGNEVDDDLAEQLPDEYLFYPAQYWEHKNHVRLLEAVATLRDERGIETPLVLVGGEKNAYEDVQSAIDQNDLGDLVHQLGYVENEAMYTLYTQATALVMPTFFGPTNIPVLEAFKLGCPVITSDVHGIPEQVGDAGLLVDPESATDIADAVERLWTDESLQQRLAERGRERAETYTRDDFRDRLVDAISASLN
ncbi:glycosyltransferase family 4 protein [Halobaculum sp. D14]|uniref:glycosyltransferase family 4 protein n=1 Tax=Halobaculum sp. D14 TaxID=3421642 RepID=UPI003EB6E6BC